MKALLADVKTCLKVVTKIQARQREQTMFFNPSFEEVGDDLLRLLPVQTLSDMEVINGLLENPQTYNELIYLLKGVGGKDFAQRVRLTMRKLMMDEVAVCYSLKGTHLKKKFLGTKACDAVLEAVQSITGERDEKKAQFNVGEFLRLANTRLRAKQKI